ncbi:hypothetical protein OM076_41635 [Solirubrobacter ginsenosidimutans]|uniref:Uncharacterized protein n=1 Tax=Solirubrobacter ginsenosidimutans TaxID=490573 RepID=A0A9X3N598_9ACTN|nr:hypothetical protein [Solirubrobacter ginsenosidimutans]MDA0166837.1 hypothetical protein [Solirubrobacter ginsenosidimutans]
MEVAELENNGCRTTVPAVGLDGMAVRDVFEAAGGVLATVGAHDADGARYTLTYELGVTLTDRWYVTSIQAFPFRP